MASNVTSVREMLNQQGIDNNRIGWDSKRGTVMVDNREFMKPNKVYQGTSYADQPGFNQAFSAYQRSIQPQQNQQTQGYQPNGYKPQNLIYDPSQGRAQPTNLPYDPSKGQPIQQLYGGSTQQQMTQGQTAYQNPYQGATPSYANPVDNQINDMIGSIMQQMNNREQFDPYSSPAYEAAQARSQRAAQQGIRAAQESLGSAGFGRSTVLGERAQGIQNDQNEYLMTQVIPQIIAQNEAKKQQELQNRLALLNPLMRQEEFAKNIALQEGQLTGRYMPPGAQPIIDNILDLKRQAESGIGPDQVQNLSAQADVLRGQLRAMGVDPSFIESDVGLDQARTNVPTAGIPTLAAQDIEYNKARDAILDERYKLEFDEDVRRYGEKFAFDKAIRQGQLDISRYNAQTSRMGEERIRSGQNLDNLYRQWETTGIAPEGIPGIEAGSPFPKEGDPKQFEAQVISGMTQFDNAEDALGWITANSEEITRQLGAKGYEDMRKAVQSQFPTGDKATQDIRNRAVSMAQNDVFRWNQAKTPEQKEQLIREYEELLRVQ